MNEIEQKFTKPADVFTYARTGTFSVPKACMFLPKQKKRYRTKTRSNPHEGSDAEADFAICSTTGE